MRFSVLTVCLYLLLTSSFAIALPVSHPHSELTRPSDHGTHPSDGGFSPDIERREPQKRSKSDPKTLKGKALGRAVKKQMRNMKLPHTSTKFHVNGGPTYTGSDVRDAAKELTKTHLRANAGHFERKGKTPKPLVNFRNEPHEVPHTNALNDQRPLNSMVGKGLEYPIGDPRNKGPARVIAQADTKGRLHFQGVIAHDMSRTRNDPGYFDHFQVHPTQALGKKSKK